MESAGWRMESAAGAWNRPAGVWNQPAGACNQPTGVWNRGSYSWKSAPTAVGGASRHVGGPIPCVGEAIPYVGEAIRCPSASRNQPDRKQKACSHAFCFPNSQAIPRLSARDSTHSPGDARRECALAVKQAGRDPISVRNARPSSALDASALSALTSPAPTPLLLAK